MVPSAALAGLVAPITSRRLLDGVLALERHHDDRAFGHELDQAAEERPLLVHGVEALGLLLGSGASCAAPRILKPAFSIMARISPA